VPDARLRAPAATAIVALCVLAEFAASTSRLPRAPRLAVLILATSAALAATLWGHMGLGRQSRGDPWLNWSRSMVLSTLALALLMVAVLALEFAARGRAGSAG
jgi:hypothetical protein